MAYHANFYVNCNHTQIASLHTWSMKERSLCYCCTARTHTHPKKPQSHQEVTQNFLVKSRKACEGGEPRGGERVCGQKNGGRWKKSRGIIMTIQLYTSNPKIENPSLPPECTYFLSPTCTPPPLFVQMDFYILVLQQWV